MRAERRLISHTSNDDLWHSSGVCLSRVLGLFWAAWLLIQGSEGIIERVCCGVRWETKQQSYGEIKCRQNYFGKTLVHVE
jgi:hypothetical protein